MCKRPTKNPEDHWRCAECGVGINQDEEVWPTRGIQLPFCSNRCLNEWYTENIQKYDKTH